MSKEQLGGESAGGQLNASPKSSENVVGRAHNSPPHTNTSLLSGTTVAVIVQSLSCIQLFVTPWTAACQAPLSSTISQSLLKFVSIESVTLSNHPILCCPLSSCLQSFPASESFPNSWLFTSGSQSIGTSASALPMNIHSCFLGLTGLISLLSKRLSRVFSSTTI